MAACHGGACNHHSPCFRACYKGVSFIDTHHNCTLVRLHIVCLQERLNVLEVLVQRQQQALAEQQQPQRVHTPRQIASPRLPRSPTRSCSSPSSGAAMAAAAAIAVNSPVGGVLCSRDAALSEGPPSSNRLYKSEEWGFPACSSGRKSFISPIDPVGHRSFNSLLTPTSASGGLKVRLAGW